MEKTAYIILIIIGLVWISGLIIGMIAIFPIGIIGLLAIIAFAILLFKVLKDRLNNKEDDYYSKNIDE